MIIKRFKSFSNTETKDKDHSTRNSVIAGAGLIGAEEAYKPFHGKVLDKLDNQFKAQAKDKETKKLYRKLKKNFLKSGKSILEEGIDNEGSRIIQSASGIIEEGPKKGHKIVQMTSKNTGNASVLGHELGHLHYLTNSKADKVGRYAHKLGRLSEYSPYVGFGVGFASGVRSSNKMKKGEKESLIERTSGDIAAVVPSIPRFIAEGKASQHGYKELKRLGASKKALKQAKGNYKKMLSTYLVGTATNVGLSELGRAAGRAYQNQNNKDKSHDSKA